MSGLVSYGGDSKIVATRTEIDRIVSLLASVQNRLVDELAPLAQLHGIVHHLQLDVSMPEVLVRLGLQRHGCFVAGESYFTTDARVAHRLNGVGEFLESNPWLVKKVPAEVWLALGATATLAGFSNTNFSALALRFARPLLPVEELGRISTELPNGAVRLTEVVPRYQEGKPRTLESLAHRLNNKDGNIRIERYSTPEGKLAVVYLPGTGDWNPLGNSKPFDLRSDLELASGQNSKSIEAANAAINRVGLTADEKVILVGYSQGGMVATELAESHAGVVGIVTLGAPVAGSEIPRGIPTISLEHSNDVVPALSGKTNPFTENWVSASRHLELRPGETVLEAHKMSNYQQTAALADSSTDSGMLQIKQRILSHFQDATQTEVREFSPTKAALVP